MTGTYNRARNLAGTVSGGESSLTEPRLRLSADEWVEHWERELARAFRDAKRRGIRCPGLAPEVLRAKSFLRYWRAVKSQREERSRA